MFQRSRLAILILGLPALLAVACGKDDPKKPGVDVDAAGGSGGGGGVGSGTGGSSAPGTGGSGGSGGAGEVGASAYDAAAVPAMVALEDSPKALASVMCEKLYGCCAATDIGRQIFTGQTQCEQAFTESFKFDVAAIMASAAANRVSYDGAALGTCLKAYQDSNCDALRGKPPINSYLECAYLVAKVDVGAACERDFDCKAGYCAAKKCAAKKPDGQPCGSEGECTGRCAAQSPRTCVAMGPPLCMAP